MPIHRAGWFVVGGLLAAALLGCQQDEIQRYRAPKPEVIEGPAGSGKTRMLGAIVPHGNRTWFFKFVGPADVITEHRGQFERFLQSVHFTDDADEPVQWQVPDGWREERGGGMRFAALHLANDDSAELTVTSFDQAAGGVLANVNRWRKQLDLPAVTEADLAKVTKETKVDGRPATAVDMTGTGSGRTRMPPFAGGQGPFAAGAAPPPHAGEAAPAELKYTTPAGWKEVPDPTGIRKLLFQVNEGGESAEVGVTSFAGAGGGLAANVNRWRGQLGLEPAGEEQLRQAVHRVEVDGKPAGYVDLSNRGKRLLGVVAVHGGSSWFITMKGPAGLLDKQKSAFEAFVKSLRFEGGRGANDG